MTPEQVALYAPILLAGLAAARVFFQLSRVINKVDTIDKRMEKMEKLHVSVVTLQTKFGERSKAVDRRLGILEGCGNPNLPS